MFMVAKKGPIFLFCTTNRAILSSIGFSDVGIKPWAGSTCRAHAHQRRPHAPLPSIRSCAPKGFDNTQGDLQQTKPHFFFAAAPTSITMKDCIGPGHELAAHAVSGNTFIPVALLL
jgi:hypothetical protein